MIDSQVQAFAELGRLFRQTRFAEFAQPSDRRSVSDPEVIEEVRSLLEEDIGSLDQVTDLTIDDADTIRGQATQRVSLGKSQIYQFAISTGGIVYQMVNAADMAEFRESDDAWIAIVDYAAKAKSSRAGKKLNCKPGNMQCGGKCQRGDMKCSKNPTPEQKAKVESITSKAKGKKTTTKAKAAETQEGAAQKPKTTTESAKPKPFAIPSEEEFKSAKFKELDTGSLHEGSIFKARVGDQDYFVKRLKDRAINAELTSKDLADDLGLSDHYLPAAAITKGGRKHIVNPLVQTEEVYNGAEIKADALDATTARKLATFDALIGAVDRNPQNLIGSNGRVLAIDNEFSFGNTIPGSFQNKKYGLNYQDVSTNSFFRHASRLSGGDDAVELDRDVIRAARDNFDKHRQLLESRGLNTTQYEARLKALEEVANSDKPTFKEFMKKVDPKQTQEQEKFWDDLFGSDEEEGLFE